MSLSVKKLRPIIVFSLVFVYLYIGPSSRLLSLDELEGHDITNGNFHPATRRCFTKKMENEVMTGKALQI